MKRLGYIALLGLSAPIWSQSFPDCFLQIFNATAAGVSANFDNRNVGCTTWTMTYNSQGFSALSVELDSAPNAAGGVPGAFTTFAGTVVTGTNPSTTVNQGSASFSGYYPWVRLNATSLTGTGTITVLLFGYKPIAIATGGSSGPTSNVNITQIGGASVVADPCQQLARTTGVINLTGSARIVVGTAAKQTYVCYLQFSISATADNIALVEGTGSTCASGTAGMAGGTTAATGWNLVPNGSVTGGGITSYGYRTATAADDVCLLASSAAQISGVVQYVQQ